MTNQCDYCLGKSTRNRSIMIEGYILCYPCSGKQLQYKLDMMKKRGTIKSVKKGGRKMGCKMKPRISRDLKDKKS